MTFRDLESCGPETLKMAGMKPGCCQDHVPNVLSPGRLRNQEKLSILLGLPS